MSELHALFVRRVREELKARNLNPHSLEEYGIKQRTLADVLHGADPRLSTVRNTAIALGMKPADLLREGPDRRITNITDLHGPTPPMLSKSHPAGRETAQDRTKRRR